MYSGRPGVSSESARRSPAQRPRLRCSTAGGLLLPQGCAPHDAVAGVRDVEEPLRRDGDAPGRAQGRLSARQAVAGEQWAARPDLRDNRARGEIQRAHALIERIGDEEGAAVVSYSKTRGVVQRCACSQVYVAAELRDAVSCNRANGAALQIDGPHAVIVDVGD